MRTLVALSLLAALANAQRPWRRVSQSPYLFLDLAMSSANDGYAVTLDMKDSNDLPLSFSSIQTTSNGGFSFRECYRIQDSLLAFSTGVATQSASSAVTSGPSLLGFFSQGNGYTTDGSNFRVGQYNVESWMIMSFTIGAEVIQNTRNGYAIAGDFFLTTLFDEQHVQGAAVTLDGGANWRIIAVPPQLVGIDTVVAGSYPSEFVWYLVTSQSPVRVAGMDGVQFTENMMGGVKLSEKDANSTTVRTIDQLLKKYGPTIAAREAKTEKNGRGGAVYRTSNGGVTWNRVFETGSFAPLKITCPTVLTCFMTGSGFRIMSTDNGGSTWRESYRVDDPSDAVYDISCASAQECYAVGGKFLDFKGWWLYTGNGGVTWTKTYAPEMVYPNTVSFTRVNNVNIATSTSYSTTEGSGVWVTP